MLLRTWSSVIVSACALAIVPSNAATADIADELNRVRLAGCERRSGAKTPFTETTAMNEIAREWSRGGRLRDAIERTDHRLQNSSSLHVEGSNDEAALLSALVASSCEILVDPTFTHIGVHRSGDQVWVVVGKPFERPNPGNAATVSARALQLVNAARAKPRKCGRRAFQAAPPLRLAPLLERAALAHAKDMATHDRFEHLGSDGSRPADRVTRAGYVWRNVAENIAAGETEVEHVIEVWLASPGHCANIMDPRYEEMAIAYFVDEETDIYWAQVFGTQR